MTRPGRPRGEHRSAQHEGSPMPLPPLVPKGQALRRAVRWLAERGEWTAARIDEASRQFDLSPADEEFLLQEARGLQDAGVRPGAPPSAGRHS